MPRLNTLAQRTSFKLWSLRSVCSPRETARSNQSLAMTTAEIPGSSPWGSRRTIRSELFAVLGGWSRTAWMLRIMDAG